MSADVMKKYWEDSYVFFFDAEVKETIIQNNRIGVIFFQTYFYPEGGGQPSDRGKIGTCLVLDVQEVNDSIVHYVQSTPEAEIKFVKGACVPCEIDKDYRIHNMRLHTSCHLLFGAARRLFPEVKYAGFNIGEVGNLYLETPLQIRADDLREMSLMANKCVVDNHGVKDYFLEKESINSIKDFAFNIELPEGNVRVIEIEGWDIAACSGTHMRRTIEIGPIKILDREIHKKNVTRIDYAIGERAVREIYQDEKILAESSEFLSTSKDSLFQIIKKNYTNLQTSQKEQRKISEKLLEYRILELKEKGKIINGIRLIIDAVDFLDANSCKVMATKLLTDSTSTVVAIISGREETAIAAGCSNDLNLEISPIIINIARNFGGGGGGKPTFVATGGMKADIGTIQGVVEQELTALLNKKN